MPAASGRPDDGERQPLLRSSSLGRVTSSSRGCADVEAPEPTSSFSCCGCLTSYVPIEVLVLGYNLSRVMVIVLTGFYFFDEASRWNGDPSMDVLDPCGQHAGSPADKDRAADVQKDTLQLTMIGNFAAFMTAVVPAVFLGPATDSLGRRIGFVLPLLGTIARAIVFLFVLGTGASVYYIYIGMVMEGLGGGFGTYLLTAFSAAADVTTPGRERALRICIIEAVNVFGSAVAGFAAGQWRRVNYTQPLMFAAALGVATLIYTLWGWPETLGRSTPSPPLDEEIRQQQGDERETLLPSSQCQQSQGRVGSRGQGPPSILVDRVGTNGDDRQETGRAASGDRTLDSDKSPPEATRSDAHGGGNRNTSGSLRYFSFSPTGHRLSNAARRTLTNNPTARMEGTAEEYGGTDTGEPPYRFYCPPDTLPPSQAPVSCCAQALTNVRKSWGVYFSPGVAGGSGGPAPHPERRRVLALCLLCFVLAVAVNFSKPSVEKVFRLAELCWNAMQETEFDSGWLVQHWVFILIALHLLQRRLHVSNVGVAMVGCVSALFAPLLFILATLPDIDLHRASILVFASAASGTLARSLIPMLRAIASSVVRVDEQGALFVSYACVELAGAAVFDLAVSQVYKATVHVWKGIIFVIMTFFFVVVMFLLVYLSAVLRRSGSETRGTERLSARRHNIQDAA